MCALVRCSEIIVVANARCVVLLHERSFPAFVVLQLFANVVLFLPPASLLRFAVRSSLSFLRDFVLCTRCFAFRFVVFVCLLVLPLPFVSFRFVSIQGKARRGKARQGTIILHEKESSPPESIIGIVFKRCSE